MQQFEMSGEGKMKTFDEAAQEFDRTPVTVKLLRPYKDRIAELRAKGASYRLISDLLKHDNITVSRMSVARFCYAVLKPTRRRNVVRQPVEPTHAPLPADSSPSLTIQPHTNGEGQASWLSRKRGPRIADSKNL